MVYIKDLLTNYDAYSLPEEFVKSLPVYCPICNAPLVMSETLTGLHCSNPKCGNKMVMRIRAMCEQLNILGFGEANIEKYIDLYKPTYALEIFNLQVGQQLGTGIGQEVSKKIITQINEKKNFLLWEYVRIANLPNVQTSARMIFQGYDTLEDAYRDIEAGGIEFIRDKLGIQKESDNEISIRATKVYNTLIEFKPELTTCIKYVNLVTLGNKPEINVVVSDQAGEPYKTKPEFYNDMKLKYGDKVHINFLTSVTKKTNYLIWAGADGSPARQTNKVNKVRQYQSQGLNIPILTARQFIDQVMSKY